MLLDECQNEWRTKAGKEDQLDHDEKETAADESLYITTEVHKYECMMIIDEDFQRDI